MDPIFKAMADPARRDILDALRAKDGQSLSDLGAHFEMTRFGVMKHLGVLEEAGLITTKKQGRFKYHYLNVLPLQEALDRWIAPLVRPAARSILDLKARLEGNSAEAITHRTFIAAPPSRVWEALTSAEAHSAFGAIADTVTRVGPALIFQRDGEIVLTLSEMAAETPQTLHLNFEPKDRAPSEITFRLHDEAGQTALTLEHRGEGAAAYEDTWLRTLSGLKTFIETGAGSKFRAFPPAAPDPSEKETPK
ncbi:MAG: metalloregulator ArsR/SmtB family transcription factor [Pseudomonadota bacterium]